jgi:co-chaperonin GroES (HSP10)
MTVQEFSPRPLRVLVKPLGTNEKIIIDKKEKPKQLARVIKTTSKVVKEGDLVIIDEYVGTTIEFDDMGKLLLIKPFQILGTTTDENLQVR